MTPIRLKKHELERILEVVTSNNAKAIVRRLYKNPVCSIEALRCVNDNYSSVIHNSINGRLQHQGIRIVHQKGKYFFVHLSIANLRVDWKACNKPRMNIGQRWVSL